jgi:hypothetical protein
VSDPASTRLFIDYQNYIPDNTVLSFTDQTEVANYFGENSIPAKLASEYFTGPNASSATMDFIREGLGQRPHLLGGDLSDLSTSQLQDISGPLSIQFSYTPPDSSHTYDYNYSVADVDLASATSFASAAPLLTSELNSSNQTPLSTLSDAFIRPVTVDFTASMQYDQLDVTWVAPYESLVVGGKIFGTGIHPRDYTDNQIIYDHSSDTGGPGHYSTAANVGDVGSESMIETYGILTYSSASGDPGIAIGQHLTGPGIPPETAVIAKLGHNEWLINNAVSDSGTFHTTVTPLQVHAQILSPNNEFLEIQPNVGFGFDQNPSTISYASGQAATELDLTAATKAIDSSPGGQHPTISQWMNQVLLLTDSDFGSFQTNKFSDIPFFEQWDKKHSDIQFLPNLTSTTPAG